MMFVYLAPSWGMRPLLSMSVTAITDASLAILGEDDRDSAPDGGSPSRVT